MQFFEVLRPLSLYCALLNLSVESGHDEDVEIVVSVREECNLVPLRRNCRARIIKIAFLGVIGKSFREVFRSFALRDIRIIEYFLFFLPAVGKLLDGQTDRRLESGFNVPRSFYAVEDLANLLFPVFVCDVVPHRLTASVCEISAEVIDRGEVVVHSCVPQEHIRICFPSQCRIFRQPLIHPLR